MATIYLYDNNGKLTGSEEVLELNSLPYNSTLIAPPIVSGAEYCQFINGAWLVKKPYIYTDNELAEIALNLFNANKAQKIQALKAWHDSQIEAMKSKYSKAEIDSFLDKRNEAMAWRANSAAPTPYIDAMSGGISAFRTMLLNAILAKVDATAQLEALVLSKRDAIEACTTQAQLDAVTW